MTIGLLDMNVEPHKTPDGELVFRFSGDSWISSIRVIPATESQPRIVRFVPAQTNVPFFGSGKVLSNYARLREVFLAADCGLEMTDDSRLQFSEGDLQSEAGDRLSMMLMYTGIPERHRKQIRETLERHEIQRPERVEEVASSQAARDDRQLEPVYELALVS